MAERAVAWDKAGRPDGMLLAAQEAADWNLWIVDWPKDAPEVDLLTCEFVRRSYEKCWGSRDTPSPRSSSAGTSLVTHEGILRSRGDIVGRASATRVSLESMMRRASHAGDSVAGPQDQVARRGAPSASPRAPPPRPSPPPPRAAPPPPPPPGVPLNANQMETVRTYTAGKAVAPPVTAPQTDLVDVSVFAPPRAKPASSILVQVMLHMAGDLQDAQERAGMIDDAAVLRGNTTLEVLLPRGAKAIVMLSDPALVIVQPVQAITWRGRLGVANFVVKLPHSGDTDLFPTVYVSVDGAVVGEVTFKLGIGGAATPAAYSRRETTARKYRRVFFSYSSVDRQKALEIAQSYRVAGIEFFQDILNLDPGHRWERQLYGEIDNCDLFLLFWSRAAAESEWVAKEARYALERREASEDKRPDLVPLILEGPPAPTPPDFLQHLHFNDWMRFAITAIGTKPA